jgi:hypothetical protein
VVGDLLAKEELLGRTMEPEARLAGHVAKDVSLGTGARMLYVLYWQLQELDPTGSYQDAVPVSPHPHLAGSGQAGTASLTVSFE